MDILYRKIILAGLLICFISCDGGRTPVQSAVYPGLAAAEGTKKEVPLRQVATDSAFIRALEDYFEEAINNGQIIGAGVAIVHKEGLIYQGGFGKRKASASPEIDKNTIFRIGSLSKGFAGILGATLVDEGKLSWEGLIYERIPEFQLSDSLHTQQVSLAHILSHSSGMPYHTYTNLVEANLSLRAIAKQLKEVKNLQPIGEIFSYQNAVFALSGTYYEAVTNQDVPILLAENIFKPLGMKNASTSYQAMKEAKNIAYPHKGGDGNWWTQKLNQKYYNAIAAGGINASASDMGKWLYLLLGQRPDVVTRQSLEAALSPQIASKDHYRYYSKWPGHKTSYYGFGWRMHTFDTPSGPDTLVHHGGYVNGYRSEIAVSQAADLGICVLFNSSNALSRTCVPDILALYKKFNSTGVIPPDTLTID